MKYQNAIKSIPSILRWKQVEQIIPWSKSYTYALIKQDLFPKPRKLTAGGQAVGWLASDIDSYMRSLAVNMERTGNE
jgi:predicted DNA-binding transcriptional regulator AlpA